MTGWKPGLFVDFGKFPCSWIRVQENQINADPDPNHCSAQYRYRRYHPAGMAKIPTGVFDLDTDGSSWTNLDPDKFFQIPDDQSNNQSGLSLFKRDLHTYKLSLKSFLSLAAKCRSILQTFECLPVSFLTQFHQNIFTLKRTRIHHARRRHIE